jgi:hypothetical protein
LSLRRASALGFLQTGGVRTAVNKVVIIIFVLIVIGGAYLLRSRDTQQDDRFREGLYAFIHHHIERDLFKYPYLGGFADIDTAYYENVVQGFNELSQKQKDVAGVLVNALPDPNYINVYFFRKNPPRSFPQFEDNCAYTGVDKIIICDIGFVEEHQILRQSYQMLVDYEIRKGKKSTSEQPAEDDDLSQMWVQVHLAVNQVLLLWLIGHEIGHIAHNHQGTNHFIRSDFTRKVSRKQEQEADEFAALATRGVGIAHLFYMGIAQLVQRALAKALEEQHPDRGKDILHSPIYLPDDIVLKFPKWGTHPPTLWRALHIQLLLINKGLVIDTSGYYERLMEKIVFLEWPYAGIR